MVDTAAWLVDHVLPAVKVRQWVLSLPYRVRLLCAYDPAFCTLVRQVFVRAVLGLLRRRRAVRDLSHSCSKEGAVEFSVDFGAGSAAASAFGTHRQLRQNQTRCRDQRSGRHGEGLGSSVGQQPNQPIRTLFVTYSVTKSVRLALPVVSCELAPVSRDPGARSCTGSAQRPHVRTDAAVGGDVAARRWARWSTRGSWGSPGSSPRRESAVRYHRGARPGRPPTS